MRVAISGTHRTGKSTLAEDLAMGTQSLAQIDQDIASSLSRIYGLQRTYLDQTRGILQAVYLRPLSDNYAGLAAYYGDVVLWEPALIRMYDEVLPRIDRHSGNDLGDRIIVGGSPAERPCLGVERLSAVYVN